MMKQDEIIRMMKEAGFYIGKDDEFEPAWKRFAALVAAHAKSDQINTAYQQGCEDMKRRMEKRMQQLESQLQLCQTAVAAEREACANTCEEEAEEWSGRTEPHEAVVRCAAAIRGRGDCEK